MKYVLGMILIGLSISTLRAEEPIRSGSQKQTSQSTANTFTLVRATAPGGLFTDSEPLDFDFKLPAAAQYRVCDIYGDQVQTGTVKPGRNRLPALPRGSYFLTLSSAGTMWPGNYSFAVLPPRSGPPTGAAAVVCLDSGLDATSYRRPREIWRPDRELMIAVCERIGVGTTRGRSGWREEKLGQYDFEPQIEAGKLARAHNVDILGMSDMPGGKWTLTGCTWKSPMGEFQRRRHRGLPDDLRRTYIYFRDFSQAAKGAVTYYEFMNEPDLDGYPAWEVAAQSKAAFLGFRNGNPDLKVTSPSFCQTNLMYMANYLNDTRGMYFDIFNCHIYYQVAMYPRILEIYRSALKNAGLGNRAIFVTEFGSGYEDACRQGGFSPLRPNIHVPTFEQELVMAEFAVKAFLRWIEVGADKAFLFYLPPYFERGGLKEWGQLRFNRTARPSLGAIAVLTAQLNRAAYAGTLTPAPGCKGMLFREPSGEEILAVWKRSEIDRLGSVRNYTLERGTPITLKVRPGSYSYCDMYGTKRRYDTANGNLTIPVSSCPGYLRGPGGFRVEPGQVKAPGSTVASEPADFNRNIVLRLITQTGFTVDSSRNFARLAGHSGQMLLEVYNFGNKAEKGTISFQGDEVGISGLPEQVALAPQERKTYPLTLKLHSNRRVRSRVALTGEFGGKKITPASANLILQANSDTLQSRSLSAANQASAWRANSSGRMTISQDGDAVRFTTDFSGTVSRWCYPEYLLRDGDTLSQAIGFSMEWKFDEATKTSNKCRVYLATDSRRETGAARTCVFYVPANTQWNRLTVYFGQDEEFLRQVKQIRIGMNPIPARSDFKIRNFRLLYQR